MPSGGGPRPLPALPPPARLVDTRARQSTIGSATPPRSQIPQSRVLSSSPTSSFRYPVPRIPGFENLVDDETDSDDELLLPGAASHPGANISRSATSPTLSPQRQRVDEGIAGSSSSSTPSVRVDGTGNPRHATFTEAAHGGPLDATTTDDSDLTAAARRAEVRRLTHKMMLAELRKEEEQRAQVPRQYKRSIMSTISEDPSDAAGLSDGGLFCNSAETAGGGEERHRAQPAVAGSGQPSKKPTSSGANAQKNMPRTARPISAFMPLAGFLGLQTSCKAEPLQDVEFRGRVRSARPWIIKAWKRSSLAATEPRQAVIESGGLPPQEPVPSTELASVKKDEISTGSRKENGAVLGTTKPNTSNAKETQQQLTPLASALQPENIDPNRAHGQSKSLSSTDTDGSIHEAREAHVVALGRPRLSSNNGRSGGNTAYDDDPDLPHSSNKNHNVSCLLQVAADHGTKHVRGPSRASEASRISSLVLPPPLVTKDFEESKDAHVLRRQSDGNTAPPAAHTPAIKCGGVASKNRPQTLPSRKGFIQLQFSSLGRLNPISGSKTSKAESRTLPLVVDGESKPKSASSEKIGNPTHRIAPESTPRRQRICRTPLDSHFKEDIRPSNRGCDGTRLFKGPSIDAYHFPETWWRIAAETSEAQFCDTPLGDGITERNQGAYFGANESRSVLPGNWLSDGGDNSNRESIQQTKPFYRGIGGTFKYGMSKIIPTRRSLAISRPAICISPPVSSGRGHIAHTVSKNPEGHEERPQETLSPAVKAEVIRSRPGSQRKKSLLETGAVRQKSHKQGANTETPSPTFSRQSQDTIEGIESIFGELVNVGENQERTSLAQNQQYQKKHDSDFQSQEKPSAPLTAPSTPVTQAYAKIQAYLVKERLENRGGGIDEHLATTVGGSTARGASPFQNLQEAQSKPADACSIKSDTTPVKRPFDKASSPSKYMTWNGPTKAQPPLMESTLEFGTELEKILRSGGEESNLSALTSQTLDQSLRYD
ncbi:c6 zinc finger domain containing protein [Niveomyces insectorum RCEF 264]|uniref:C6 zinc finger domain containing protein n=1 Tax=Niveomyces insectorum RCEF 264 TaxID=1081102 RepID=A0A167TTI1_9HYPO|nr:c6 zinc finger domain containing protein [Niveomyces insectorum RCEF 264]